VLGSGVHLLLSGALCDDRHDTAHRDANLDGHVSEATQPHHAEVVACLDAVLLEWRVARDARAQQRRRRSDVHLLGHHDRKRLLNDDVGRVASLRHPARVFLLGAARTIGAREAATGAELLVAVGTLLARAARVHHAPNARDVAHLELGDLRADGDDAPEDLVADAERVLFGAPLALAGVDVGVADARVRDGDVHVLGTDRASVDLVQHHLRAARRSERSRCLRGVRR
jgi:hypothetical protein